jgi:Fe-Mn family superoxide dismutase
MLVHEAYFESLGTSAAGANLAAATPILALDMYEHSYHMDYGARAAAYVDAVMNNLNLESAGRKLAALQGA